MTDTPENPPAQAVKPALARKARYIMIGGFLGAGKTTALGQLARRLVSQGLRVGLITNDQGQGLVDTALLRAQGFATEEIPGGCFCCRFQSLMEAARRLGDRAKPDVFLAEPVGSCTDLAATVTYPLRRLYGENYIVAPVSVMVDPIRAARVLGLEKGANFSTKVLYIYRKQLEEADLVVISKRDLLSESQLARLRSALEHAFPGKEILAVSAREGAGLEVWFERITHGEQASARAMNVDYQLYAEGEALLGWLNATIQLEAEPALEANHWLVVLAGEIQRRLAAAQAEVAHLKMTLSPENNLTGEIASVSLVRNDLVPELTFRLEEPVVAGQLVINLRAEAAPETLEAAVRDGLAAAAAPFPHLRAMIEHLERFRPGKPTPTHRLETA